MPKRRTKGERSKQEQHFHNLFDLLLFVIPARARKPFSIVFILLTAVVIVYTYRFAVNDIWYRFVLHRPISISLLRSEVYCDERMSPKNWRDVLSYWETNYDLRIRLKSNILGDVIRLDSVRVKNQNNTLQTTWSDMHLEPPILQGEELQPQKPFDVKISPNGRLSQDSIWVVALLASSVTVRVYSDFGSQDFSIDSVSFFDNNQKFLYTVRSE